MTFGSPETYASTTSQTTRQANGSDTLVSSYYFNGMGAATYSTRSANAGTVFDVNGNILSSTANPQLIPGTPSYTGNPGYYGGNNGIGNTFSGASASNTASQMNPNQ